MRKSGEIHSYDSHCRSKSTTSCGLFVACTAECRVNFYGLRYIRVMRKGYSRRGSHNSEFSDSYDLKVSLKWLLFFIWVFVVVLVESVFHCVLDSQNCLADSLFQYRD